MLGALYPDEEVLSFFYLLAEKYLGLKKTDIAFQLGRVLTEKEITGLNTALAQLEKEAPVQYILGETEFYGLRFKVTPAVLIPRPETEELVGWIVKDTPNSPIKILDIGTGSGCIAVSLTKNIKNANVSAMDVSAEALKVAGENALLNKVNVTLIQDDVLKLHKLHQGFDIIVSNPPYVRVSEKQKMQANVLNFEPHTALFVPDNDPLLFYKKIAALAKNHLNPEGKLYLEINEAFGVAMAVMLKQEGFEAVELKKDIFGRDRMIKACIL